MGCNILGRLDQQTTFYHHHYSSLTLHVGSFQVYSTSSSLQGIKFFSSSYVWQIVSSLALWVLWKAMCSKLYNDENIHTVDQVMSFCDLLVHTIKGDYDSYKCSRNTTTKKRMRIRRVWPSIPSMLDELLMSSGIMYHLIRCSCH